MKKKYLLLAALAVVVAVLISPREITIVPAWRLRVVNEQGAPLKDVFVRQSWKHYSYELDAGTNLEDAWTDENGYVAFPQRTIKVSLIKQALAPLIVGGMLREHASFGPSAAIMAWGKDEGSIGSSVEYEPGKPLPEQLVLSPQG
ncbi:MAG: hypothetical protein ACRD9R_14480 [Pyrinomonadaceae bacterium]